jgi:hypothetical protein
VPRVRKTYPALLGGLFIGVLSALPVVSAGNLCCCLWLVAGGALAAWIMQQNHPAPVEPLDGAAVGFVSGVIGAFVYLLIVWPVTIFMAPLMEQMIERVLESAGDVPWRDALERYGNSGARAVGIIAGFVLHLVLGMIFPTIGGVLGAMLFRKRTPPPPPLPPSGWTPQPPPAIPTTPPREPQAGSDGL